MLLSRAMSKARSLHLSGETIEVEPAAKGLPTACLFYLLQYVSALFLKDSSSDKNTVSCRFLSGPT